jgi:hypothetical protein
MTSGSISGRASSARAGVVVLRRRYRPARRLLEIRLAAGDMSPALRRLTAQSAAA